MHLAQHVERESLAPAINWMEMVYLVAVVAAPLSGTRLPRWMLWSAPLVLASFALGQRRSFWLAAGFVLMLVVVLPSCGSALVIRIVFGGAPTDVSKSEVRNARYDSDI